jgi:hypothetical protein
MLEMHMKLAIISGSYKKRWRFRDNFQQGSYKAGNGRQAAQWPALQCYPG